MMQDNIRSDLTVAMKAKDEPRLTVLRGLISLFTQELTATRRTPQDKLTDEEVLALIKRSVKQRKDAAEQFRAGGRNDLAQNEDAEAAILAAYLPAQMSQEEIDAFVSEKISAMGAVDASKTGMIVGSIMKDLKGKADGAVVKSAVESYLKK